MALALLIPITEMVLDQSIQVADMAHMGIIHTVADTEVSVAQAMEADSNIKY